MTSSFITVASGFFLLVIGLKGLVGEVTTTEEELFYNLLYFFAAGVLIVPLSFYISNGLEKTDNIRDARDDSFI
ncbi:MAG: hypothetical protein ACT4NX_05310 [Deltaproteobacteria bacterium]